MLCLFSKYNGILYPSIALEPTMAQRLSKVKQLVLSQLPQEGPIYNLGYESYILDEDGAWSMMEETVATNPDTGRGEAHVNEGTVNDRAMGALDIHHHLYKHDAICKEAFQDHNDKKSARGKSQRSWALTSTKCATCSPPCRLSSRGVRAVRRSRSTTLQKSMDMAWCVSTTTGPL